MSSNSEGAALNRKLTELREQRRTTLLELKALRDRQQRVPLAGVPGVRSLLRVFKRLYLLPQMQVWQQAIDQLSLDESETFALTLHNAINVTAAALSKANPATQRISTKSPLR
jgi:hypothetical protein